MAKTYTHTEAFAYFGTKPANVMWSWSALNEETSTVAVTLWQDEWAWTEDGRRVYEAGAIWAESRGSPGHGEMIRNLRWALDHCDGWVKVISAIAKDPNASPRSIKECAPTKMQVKVTHVNEATGEFSLEAYGLKKP